MPTQRFLNLKDSKKNAILEAAAHEFARVPYSAVSINQIIKEAEISRGSFYTYFEDKDDLMRYMLRGFRDTLRKKVFEFLEEEEEDQAGRAASAWRKPACISITSALRTLTAPSACSRRGTTPIWRRGTFGRSAASLRTSIPPDGPRGR